MATPRHETLEPLGEWIQTTDATVTTISYYLTGKGKTYEILARVVGLKSDFTAGAGYRRSATFRGDAAGTLTQIGTTTSVETNEDNAAWDCEIVGGTIVADGATRPCIIVRVTGVAATTINWRAGVEVNKIGFGPDGS